MDKLLILVLTAVSHAIEYSEIGLSAQLKEQLSCGNVWAPVTGWTISKNPGFFSYGITLDTHIKIPFSGIYFISSNIRFAPKLAVVASSKYTWNITSCFENINTKNFINCASLAGKSSYSNERTLPSATFVYLDNEDSIILVAQSPYKHFILTGSSISLQYMGTMASSPGLSLVYDKNPSKSLIQGSNFKEIYNWIETSDSRTFNTLSAGNGKEETLKIRCDGIYSFVATLLVAVEPGTYEVRLVNSRGLLIAKSQKHVEFVSEEIFSLYGIFLFRAGDILKLLLSSEPSKKTFISDKSSLSIVYVGKSIPNNNEFSITVNDTTFRKLRLWQSLKEFIPTQVKEPEFLERQGISVFTGDKLTLGRSGIYFVFVQATLEIEAGDQIQLLLSLGRSARFATMSSGLSTSVSNDAGITRNLSLSIASVMDMHSNQYFSFFFRSSSKRPFRLVETTWISLVRLRLTGFVAGATLAHVYGQDKSTIAYNPGHSWVTLKPWTAIPSNSYRLNSVLNSSHGTFKSPLRAIYLVTFNLMISSRDEDDRSVEARVMARNKNDLHSNVGEFAALVPPQQMVMSASFPVLLSKDNELLFELKANGSVSISRESSLYVFLLDFQESTKTLITKAENKTHSKLRALSQIVVTWSQVLLNAHSLNEKFSNLEEIKIPRDGVYLITCNVLVFHTQSSQTSSKELTLTVATDTLGRDLSIQDKVRIDDKHISQSLSLSVIGTLRLRKGQSIKAILFTVGDVEFLGIISGTLMVKLLESHEDNREPGAMRILKLTQKMFDFEAGKWYAVNDVDFPSNIGSFKTPSITMNGPHVLATKPMFIFVATTVEIKRAKGRFEIEFQVLPQKTIVKHGLSCTVVAQSTLSVVMKLSGVVHLEQGESLELLIRSTKIRQLVISSRSSLSLIALNLPPRKYQVTNKSSHNHLDITVATGRNQRKKLQTLEKGVYIILQCCLPTYNERRNKVEASRPKIFKIEHLMANQELNNLNFSAASKAILLHRDRYNFAGFHLKSQLPLKGNKYQMKLLYAKEFERMKARISSIRESTICKVFLISVNMFIMSEAESVLLAVRDANEEQTLAYTSKINSLHNLSFYGTLCLQGMPELQLYIPTGGKEDPWYLLQGSQLSIVFIEKAEHTNGFSALHAGDELLSSSIKRQNGFNANASLSYDNTESFKSPSGSIYLNKAGKYLLTIHVVLRAEENQLRNLQVQVLKDKEPIPELEINVKSRSLHGNRMYSTSRATIIDIQSRQFIEIFASSQGTVMMSKESRISMLLLEPEAAVDVCPMKYFDLIPLKADQVVLKEHVNFTSLCQVAGDNIADLEWLKNDEIIAFSPGARNITLEVLDTSTEDSGMYQCIARKGDEAIQTKKFKLAVYDPVPFIFPSNGTFQIHENGRFNDEVVSFAVHAAKHSYEELAEVQLSIVHGDPEGNFYIVPNRTRSRSSVKVRKLLDFEKRSVFNLTIRATNAEFNGTAERDFSFTINVLDLNDNKPQFKELLHSVTIPENTEPGSLIYTITANDKDSDNNAIISYTLLYNSDSKYFNINNKTGEIYLRQNLDREMQEKHVILVIASDTVFRSFAEVVVNVKDVNDNPPKFISNHVTLLITEATLAGTVLVRVEASDPDLGTSGEVDYYLEEDRMKDDFQIDGDGNLRTKRSIEKYAGRYLILNIKAFDGGGLISENRFVAFLNVSPISYFKAPKFDKSIYSMKVPENTVAGTYITSVFATFRVQGSNFKYQIIYRLKEEDKAVVTVQQGSGKVFLSSKLNYEVTKEHKAIILACDKYATARCSEAVIEIIVVDVNDNLPLFDEPTSNLSLSESTPVGTVVHRVQATDLDGVKNNKLSYHIVSGNKENYFAIDEVSGNIILAKELDFEWMQQLVIVVIAKDSGRPSLSGTTTIDVTVLDENEHAPTFNQSEYKTSLTENNQKGTHLVTVLATDLDHGDKIKYQANCGDDHVCAKCIDVDEDSGIVKALCHFDREAQDKYQLIIEATDSGKHPLKSSAYFTLNILDVNDVAPRFVHRNMHVNVSLSTLPNSYVYCIQGIDRDLGRNQEIIYTFVPESEYFGLLPGGVVYLKKDIDPKFRDTTIILKVIATDKGFPQLKSRGFAKLSISIVGSFYSNFPGYEFLPITVRENATVGTVIGQVQKGSPCCSTRYSLQGSVAFDFFNVDPRKGFITIKQRLDFEYLSSFTFTVFGYSENQVVYKGLLKIDISDVDEKRIFFKRTKTIVSISESAPVGTIVKKMDVYHEGYKKTPKLKYMLNSIKKDSDLAFEVNDDGLIRTSRPLDFESTQKYYLQLFAIHHATENVSAVANLVIVIVDENDNNPVFGDSSDDVVVSESLKIGDLVVNAEAKDADSGENGRVTHSIISCIPSGDFGVDSMSGEIFVKNNLDYESVKEYRLHVQAKDNGFVSRYNVKYIIIKVKDENDNRPEFPFNRIDMYIKADSPVGSKVGRVKADDADEGNNGKVGYLLSSVRQNFTPFSLDFVSGEIIQEDIMTNITNYTLAISAIDNGSPPLKSKQDLTFSIHVFREHPTASLRCSVDELSSTQIELRLNLLDYFGVKVYGINKLTFVAQEYHPDDPEYRAYTQLPPLTWYDVNYRRDRNKNYLRRYLTGSLELNSRKYRERRGIKYIELTDLTFKIGVDEDCGENAKPKEICNGPLLPGTSYRFQLQAFFGSNNESVTTSFTPNFRTEALVRILQKKRLSDTFYYTFGLLAFCLAMIIVMAAVLCFIYWRKRHYQKSRREAAVQKDYGDEEEPDELDFLKRCNGTELQEIAVYFGSSSSSSIYETANTFMNQRLLPKQKTVVQSNC